MASTTTSKEEIRSGIKFCALSGQTPADTLNQITKVYGDNSVCRTLEPDLAPCDFALFPRLKAQLRGNRFNNEGELRRAVTDFVASIPAQEFKNIFVKWCERWGKCIQCKGEYFEKE